MPFFETGQKFCLIMRTMASSSNVPCAVPCSIHRTRLSAGLPVSLSVGMWVALCTILCLPCWTLVAHAAAPPVFRFSVSAEPTSIDPAHITNSESSYFAYNVMRGLYRTAANGDVVPEYATSCKTTTKPPWLTTCSLRKHARWSDGAKLQASEVVYSWRRLLTPAAKGTGIELLKSVQGAVEAHAGKIPVDEVGLKVIDPQTIEVRHSEFDPEFLAKLAHPALAIVREGFSYERSAASKAPVLGPYVVEDWSSAQKIKLRSNSFYDSHPRPAAEVLVIEDDETALGLYRSGTLSLLRRLPSHYFKAWKGSKELHFIPVARFDYLGFGSPLNEDRYLPLRRAMAQSLKYEDLQRLYDSRGRPGCPGIDRRHFERVPCHVFTLTQARELMNQIEKPPPLLLAFSKLGGDDVQKGMEWAQAQWKQNLGLDVELRAVEQGLYLQMLKDAPPPIFRKGVGLDRDSCLAAAEIFLEADPENYIRMKDGQYQSLVGSIKNAGTPSARRKACTAGVQYLIDTARIIPLGQIHFAVLAKPIFSGWTISPMNRLDLRQLSAAGR